MNLDTKLTAKNGPSSPEIAREFLLFEFLYIDKDQTKRVHERQHHQEKAECTKKQQDTGYRGISHSPFDFSNVESITQNIQDKQ